ncbi:MAG: hypothetical protein ACKVP7_08760 [Hyphomicrobiaceae bacterium]
MQNLLRRDLGHLGLCLDEMIAEVEAQLETLEAVQALAQLETREALGETLTAVCGPSLRASLKRQIASHPLTTARRKLAELQLILSPLEVVSTPQDDTATVATVTDLAAYRAERAEPVAAAVVAIPASPPAAPRRLGRTLAMLALLAATGLGSLSVASQLGRIPGFDISVTAIPTPSAAARVDLVHGY